MSAQYELNRIASMESLTKFMGSSSYKITRKSTHVCPACMKKYNLKEHFPSRWNNGSLERNYMNLERGWLLLNPHWAARVPCDVIGCPAIKSCYEIVEISN